MDEIQISDEKKSLIELFHQSSGGNMVAVPFARDIFLFETYVAGPMYNEDIHETTADMQPGTRLILLREPENSHDDLAIVIHTLEGKKIGYVPRKDNPVFARLMDAGKELFAKVKEIHRSDNYINIQIEIYLHDE